MSDRSGVGAPTHDGADPDLSGTDAPANDGSRAPEDTSSSRTASSSTTTSPVTSLRRSGRELFGSILGAETAESGTPPGVPDPTGDDDSTRANGSGAATVAEPAPAVAAPPPKGRRRLSTRATGDADAAANRDLPPVIDSSVDSGVVVEQEPEVRRGRGRGLRARRVHRIIRRVDPWSVLKLSLLFYFCVWAMVVVSGVLIWGVAVSSGTVDNIEGFIERLFAFEEFTFNADQIFRLFAMGGLILVFLGTAITAILAVLFNLISDLVGGIRVTVVEEESTRRIVSSD